MTHYPVYGPKAFATIGGLPDTLMDRCVCITMQRKTAKQKVARFLQSKVRAEVKPIRQLLAKWTEKNRTTVGTVYESMEDLVFLTDRDADLWMPLFAVCAVAAPERLGDLKQCAQVLTQMKAADDLDDSLPLELLADVRSVWPGKMTQMLTATLIEALRAIPDSSWTDYGLNARKLAKILRAYDIRPRQIRVISGTGKGYLREEFEEVFSSYLPSQGVESETSETTRANTGENAQPESETKC